jgi:hypothetical protein
MTRRDHRESDFVALYNALWYRDFPVTPTRLDINRRALWTTHIASTVKQCADLLGLFTCFETGGKTDAVIEDATGGIDRKWAKIEWEWVQPHKESVNEIEKLASAKDEAATFIFIGYSRDDHHSENIEKIKATWGEIDKPLIVFLVTFKFEGGKRKFNKLQTHRFKAGVHRKLREQAALPWESINTKWAMAEQ